MNPAEEIAGLYLRLNGFFLLPYFTIFRDTRHHHVDLLGLRSAGSEEIACNRDKQTFVLPTDDKFFTAIETLQIDTPRQKWIGVVAEVKANRQFEHPNALNVQYLDAFFGRVDAMIRISFSERFSDPAVIRKDGTEVIEVGVPYALGWVRGRINSMKEEMKLNKGESWTLSEGFLATIMLLMQYDEGD